MNKTLKIIISVIGVLLIGWAIYHYQNLDVIVVSVEEVATTTNSYVPTESDIYPAWYPFITSIAPPTARLGSTVTLTGGNWRQNAQVYIGGIKGGIAVTPISISTTTIVFKVPQDAMVGKNGVEVMLLEKYSPSSKGADLTITN